MTRIHVPSAIVLAAIALLCCGATAFAQPPCPAGTVLTTSVAVAGPGTLTIRPGGGGGVGETFAGNGLVVTVCIDCSGAPLVGLPPAAITVSAPGVVFCPGPLSNTADTPTDAGGCAVFAGTLCGGGCAPVLDVFVAGTYAGTVPVGINSPDTGVASPGFVDASDLAAFALRLGNPLMYSICADYNETGPPTIDAGDLAYFATALGAACGAVCP
jgi:hypothetical protein